MHSAIRLLPPGLLPLSGLALCLFLLPGRAAAHSTEGGFVLLLPTEHYIAGGVASVVLTVLLIAILPERWMAPLFRPLRLARWPARRVDWARTAVSALSFLLFLLALAEGLFGPQDPTVNLLPLYVWTWLWLFVVPLQALLGDAWGWLSPFRAPLALCRAAGARAMLPMPRWGHWPALVSFLAFSLVLLAHTAPTDPDTLAVLAGGYLALNLAAALVFGPRWLVRGEGLTVLMRLYADLAPLRRRGGGLRLGLPGWAALTRPLPTLSTALFVVVVLAMGSFDGLNETFWWLARIGQNPLEFSGRSAIVAETSAGALAYCAGLALIVLAIVAAGQILAEEADTARAFRAFAPTLLPIAWAYHVAHYLTAMLVEGQSLAIRLERLLGGPGGSVTTGFLNSRDTVETIFATQAAVIVLGHMLAILMSHRVAMRRSGKGRTAILAELPMAIFMIGYTLLGLWLLASPRGA